MNIFVDIDNTICRTPLLNYRNASPIYANIAKINNLYNQGHHITYWTARGTMTRIDWSYLTKTQLEKWGCKYHELKFGKPNYDLFIDDKNINSKTFFNDYPEQDLVHNPR